MQILILGGTRFVGRHLAAALSSRGHEVTIFHRGTTEPPGLAQTEHVHGDRDHDLDRLGERRFDAVVDTSAYVPSNVESAIAQLRGRTGRYLLISTVSVYEEPEDGRVDESSARATLPDGASVTEMVPETYGALKALCEDRVVATFGERATVVRPGLVVGPYDPTDRFTYWPVRFAEGGEILVPANPQRATQFIDARDLADFCVGLLEKNISGAYNAISPPGALTFGDVFGACAGAVRNDARMVWAEDDFLVRHEVGPWIELPLWIPGDEAVWFANVDTTRAVAAGLCRRELHETVRDTLSWASAMKRDDLKAGLKQEREAALLRALHEQNGTS